MSRNLEEDLLQVSKPYEIQPGDVVRNIDKKCQYYKSTGDVISVNLDGTITYKVNSKGATYTPGDEVTKMSDTLMKIFTHTPIPGYGVFTNG